MESLECPLHFFIAPYDSSISSAMTLSVVILYFAFTSLSISATGNGSFAEILTVLVISASNQVQGGLLSSVIKLFDCSLVQSTSVNS